MQNSTTPTTNELNTYIGQKGYTILKKELNDQQVSLIKKELMVRPYIPGSPVNNNVKTFPAYRESVQKYYLPRYFGEEHFGAAKEMKLSEGDNISVAFNGELREHQWGPVNSYLDKVRATSTGGGGLLDLPCAFGKTS
jgi:hypothetical protein